jgi:hypothetical protein
MIMPALQLSALDGPFFQKGQSIEWVMPHSTFSIPCVLLIFLMAGKNDQPFTVNDLPIFIVPTALHLSDILFTVLGGYMEILWIVLLASVLQTAFLLFAWFNNRQTPMAENQ